MLEPNDVELSTHLEWVIDMCRNLATKLYAENFYDLDVSCQETIYTFAYKLHLHRFHGVQA